MARLDLIRWHAPGPYDAVFSTRQGGVSEGPYAELNIGLLTGDERARTEENRRRLLASLGADAERASWPRQVHGADVVEGGARGTPADAIWTEERGIPLVVVTADCVPVVVVRADGARPAVALAHVGWRGLLRGVVERTVTAVGARVVAAVGPGIGPCCYEVGEEVSGPVAARYGHDLVSGRRLDLPGAVVRALGAAGCERVDRLDECTACRPDRYFSHRRDGGVTGRQGAVAVVR